jgi:hypothetical protein
MSSILVGARALPADTLVDSSMTTAVADIRGTSIDPAEPAAPDLGAIIVIPATEHNEIKKPQPRSIKMNN